MTDQLRIVSIVGAVILAAVALLTLGFGDLSESSETAVQVTFAALAGAVAQSMPRRPPEP